MSDLQLGLIAIGVVIICAVWAYNKWQDTKYRKLANERFAADHPDALLEPAQKRQAGFAGGAATNELLEDDIPPMPSQGGAEPVADSHSRFEPEPPRIEPTFGGAAAEESRESVDTTSAELAEAVDDVPAMQPAHADVDPSPEDEDIPQAPSSARPEPAVAASAPAPKIEEGGRIDFVARLSGSVDAEHVLELAQELAGTFRKSAWVNAWSGVDAGWVSLAPGLRCNALSMGLQLVDRDGALSAEEIARFRAGVQALAEQAGLRAELPDAGTAAGEARALDQFCAEVDIQIVLNLVASGNSFAGTKIRALAEAAGFTLEQDGHFRLRNEEGVALFALSNQGPQAQPGGTPQPGFEAAKMRELSTNAIAFQYDLPRVPGGVRSFDHFCDIARNFAGVLGGRLVDDNRAEIGPQALKAIRTQIQSVQAAMDARGLPAGSPVALRLFS